MELGAEFQSPYDGLQVTTIHKLSLEPAAALTPCRISPQHRERMRRDGGQHDRVYQRLVHSKLMSAELNMSTLPTMTP